MKDVYMIKKKVRNINPNDLIIERICSENLVPKDQKNHITLLAFNYSNCFRSASLIASISSRINAGNEGIIYFDMLGVHYGFSNTFEVVEPESINYSSYAESFLKDNVGLYDNIVINLMDTGVEKIRKHTEFLNKLVISNLMLNFNVFIFITKTQMERLEDDLSRVFYNTDNMIFIDDYVKEYT